MANITRERRVALPLDWRKGAEIRGIDAAQSSDEDAAFLRDAWNQYGLLVLKNQSVDEEQQRTLAGIFGPVSDDGEYGDQQYVSNVQAGALTPHGNLAFHMDNSWSKTPLRGLILYGIETPPRGAGGETLFSDVGYVYERLPDALRQRIDGLKIVHSYPNQKVNAPIPGPDPRPGMPTSIHPLVFPHPVTRAPLVFCSPRHFDRIVGYSKEASLALANELAGHIRQPEAVHAHAWEPGDLVVWDNLQFQHARSNFDRKHRRHLRRTQIGGPL
jgi:alpha-ketoglutarate-dependent taurine dioxygenase